MIVNKDSFKYLSKVIIAHTLFVSFLGVYFFVLNGIRLDEKERLNVFKEDYSLIKTRTDRRKGNIFFSTPDYFLKLSRIVPEVDAYLQSLPVELDFSYINNNTTHAVSRELPLFLIGNNFFDVFKGRFIHGRGFNRSEIFSGKPFVVLTEGLLLKIFGDYDEYPSMIWINGLSYQILGVWSFDSRDVVENEAIFLPLGLTHMFGKDSSTYVNNFILRGNESDVLEKLKQGIDKIQLDAGFIPVRPDFVIEKPTVSRKVDYIFLHNKVYIDVMIWLSFILYIYYLFHQSTQLLSSKTEWAMWNFMLRGSKNNLNKELRNEILKSLSLSVFISSLIVISVLIFFKIFRSFTLAFGTHIHPCFYLYLLSFIILGPFLKYRQNKISFNLK